LEPKDNNKKPQPIHITTNSAVATFFKTLMSKVTSKPTNHLNIHHTNHLNIHHTNQHHQHTNTPKRTPHRNKQHVHYFSQHLDYSRKER